MAKTTRQYVFEGMELLPEGLIPFVEKRLESQVRGHWRVEVVKRVSGLKTWFGEPFMGSTSVA